MDRPVELPCIRTYFYVGGHYEDDGTGKGQHVMTEQMYVEQLEPTSGSTQPYPLIFIHGNAQTGSNWLNTPDNRPGWASFFLSKGYTCLIVDQTLRGRSATHPSNPATLAYPAEMVQKRFTASKRYNLWPQARLHTQWPGEGMMGDPIFDAYYASTVQAEASPVRQQETMKAAGAALLDRIGKPVVLIAHSQGALAAWVIADARPELTRAIVAVEATAPPFQNSVFATNAARTWGLTDIAIAYEPPVHDPAVDLKKEVLPASSTDSVPCLIQAEDPPPRKLTNLAKVKVLVVTGEASYHAMYDHGLVAFLRQAGVDTQHMELGKMGITGNGHMLIMEKNSDEIAARTELWIRRLTYTDIAVENLGVLS